MFPFLVANLANALLVTGVAGQTDLRFPDHPHDLARDVARDVARDMAPDVAFDPMRRPGAAVASDDLYDSVDAQSGDAPLWGATPGAAGRGDAGLCGDDRPQFGPLARAAVADAGPEIIRISRFDAATEVLQLECRGRPGAGAPVVEVVDFPDGTGAFVRLDGVTVAAVTGAQGLLPGDILLRSVSES